MEENSTLEALAKSFSEFLWDSSNGGFISNVSGKVVTYTVCGIPLRFDFLEEHSCKMEVGEGYNVSEVVSIPYDGRSKKPNWSAFQKYSCKRAYELLRTA